VCTCYNFKFIVNDLLNVVRNGSTTNENTATYNLLQPWVVHVIILKIETNHLNIYNPVKLKQKSCYRVFYTLTREMCSVYEPAYIVKLHAEMPSFKLYLLSRTQIDIERMWWEFWC